MTETAPTRRDLLSTEHLPVETITRLLDRSDYYVEMLREPGPFQKLKILEGQTVANLFFENSTRTRISFELAEKRMGADFVTLTPSASSMTKGESVLDTVRVIEAMKVDAIVVRHNVSGVPEFLAERLHAQVHVINAGDGAHEHPTQALLDAAELRVALGDLRGKRIVIVGDILHSRVARSNVWLLKKLGAEVVLVGPSTLLPRDAVEVFGVNVSWDLDAALRNADAVMMLRIQMERMAGGFFPSLEEYSSRYGLSEGSRAGRTAPRGTLILHPGPVNVGVELDAETAGGERSVILKQVKRGVAVRMAVLEWMFEVGK